MTIDTVEVLNTVSLSMEALYTGNRFADAGRYMSAQMFFSLSDRLAKLSHEMPHLSPVRLYCEAVLSGMPEARADLFTTLCTMDPTLQYDLPRIKALHVVTL